MSFEKILKYYQEKQAAKSQKIKFHPEATQEVRQGLIDLLKHPDMYTLIKGWEGFCPIVCNDRREWKKYRYGSPDIKKRKGWYIFINPDTGKREGQATIGIGHVLRYNDAGGKMGEWWKPYWYGGGKKLTLEQGGQLKLAQGDDIGIDIFKHFTRLPTPEQFAAILSIAYNGGQNSKRLHRLIRLFNKGKLKEVAYKIEHYSDWAAKPDAKAYAKPFAKGWINRRRDEAKVFRGSFADSQQYKKHGSGAAAASKTADKSGGTVYILGDSNTEPHRNYWKSFAKKNFGNNIEIVWKAQGGNTTGAVLKKLKGVENAAGVIVGSIGGNNAAGFAKASKSKIDSALSPGGSYYDKHIVPFMARMKELQDQGAKVFIFGLPFGRGGGENKEYARQVMDESLAVGAQQFGIPYKSVFEATKLIKGKASGVHYSSKKEEYRDALRNSGLGNHPSSEDEIAYAKDVSNNRAGKKIKLSRNRFLRPYKYVQKAGLTFDALYTLFDKTFGSGWVDDLLPIHGKDRIFGPEHFTALAALSKKLEKINTPLAQTIRKIVGHKDPNQTEPAFADAEKETAKDITKNADLTPILPKDIFKDKPDSEIAADSSIAADNVIFATGGNFRQEAIAYSSKMPVFVDFGADYCGPCKQLDPVINKIAQKHKGSLRVVKVDIQKQPEIAKHFSSLLNKGIPLVLAFNKGKMVDSLRGFSSGGAERVNQFVNNILTSVAPSQPSGTAVAQQKPTKPATFEEVIASGKPGDQFILNFKKPVKYGGFITVFKTGKTYTGSTILPNGNVSVSSEQGTHELTMKDFVEKIQERGEPCQILNCDASFIVRPKVGKKSFANFLKNPSFDNKQLAENKIKKQKRFILKYRTNK
jgi:thiol-disulfide isomerase/thioredoxin/GH24 family phage-related lysozyme (muramidase)